MEHRLRAFALVVCAAAALAACTMRNANVSEATLTSQFQSGTAVLSCTTNCQLAWQQQRATALAEFNANQWQNLALLVMRVGYGNDVTYYYLGRAAHALGYRQAAEAYYKDSIAASATAEACARGSSVAQGIQALGSQVLSTVTNSAQAAGNGCDGFDFPDNAQTSLQIVEAELNPAPAEQRRVVHRRVVRRPTGTAASSSGTNASASQGIVEAPSSSGGAAPASSGGAAPASSSGIVEAK